MIPRRGIPVISAPKTINLLVTRKEISPCHRPSSSRRSSLNPLSSRTLSHFEHSLFQSQLPTVFGYHRRRCSGFLDKSWDIWILHDLFLAKRVRYAIHLVIGELDLVFVSYLLCIHLLLIPLFLWHWGSIANLRDRSAH